MNTFLLGVCSWPFYDPEVPNLSVCYRENGYLDKSNLQILYYEIAV